MQLAFSILAALVALALVVHWMEPRLAFFPFAGERETPRDFGVIYEQTTIPTKDGEKLRAWIMAAPAQRARVVYFHGNGGNLSNWAPILAGIVRRGYSVFAFDYRGYGMSSGHPTERGLYRDVDAVVAQAWTGSDRTAPLVFWGRSLGGTMAAYAATVRQPDGIVLEAAFPDARSAVRGSPALAFLLLFSSYRFPAADFMKGVKAPALSLHGDRDSVIPIGLGRELFGRLNEPKRFVVIPGGDHNDAAPADPKGYWAAVDEFIASLPTRRE